MSINNRSRRIGTFAAAIVGAVGLAALAMPVTPANAQVFFGCGPAGCGVGLGGFGIGVTNPYYYPPYYAPYYPPAYYPY